MLLSQKRKGETGKAGGVKFEYSLLDLDATLGSSYVFLCISFVFSNYNFAAS